MSIIKLKELNLNSISIDDFVELYHNEKTEDLVFFANSIC